MDPVSRQNLNQVFSDLRNGQLKGAAAEPQNKTQFKSKLERWGHTTQTKLDRSGKLGKILGYTGLILGAVTLTLPLYLAIKGKFTNYVHPYTQAGTRLDPFLSQVSKSQWKSLSRFSKGEREAHHSPAKDRILRSNALKIISNRAEAQELQALLKQCTTRQLCQLARGIGKEEKEDLPIEAPEADQAPAAGKVGAAGESQEKAVAEPVRTARQYTWSPAVFERLREVQRGMKSPLLDEPMLKSFQDYEVHREEALERIRFASPAGAPAGLASAQAPEQGAAQIPALKGPMPSQQLKGVRALAADLLLPSNLARASALLEGGEAATNALRQVLQDHKDALAQLCARPDRAAEAKLPAGLSEALRQTLNLPGPMPTDPAPTEAQWQDHLQQVQSAIESLQAEQARDLGQAMMQTVDQFDFSPYSKQLQAIDTGVGGPMGSFFDEVFEKYFDSQPPEDRRNMVASLLRQSTPVDSREHQLAALLKGAGPFMHKTLQLFCDMVTDESTKTALSSVKTGLTPIDRELKTAMLAQIVKDSGGKIQALNDVRTLGAASVGEALLADVKLPPNADGQPRTQRVVIKLLRPGIVERAQRERAFFAETASHHTGMGQTFAGIADQIETEMNLQSEALNVQRGQVYQGKAKDVAAMALSDLTPPRPGYMLVEQAQGSALQSYIDLCEKAARGEKVPGSFNALEYGRQAALQVAELGRVWLAQALAGNGFFHGDLHAGNLMFSGDTGVLTAIDFGNAATIDPKQQQVLLRLGMTLASGHPRLFEKQFRRLLGPTAESLAWHFKESMVSEIRSIMRDGRLGIPEKLANILEVYTAEGIEVPAVLSNFSRSMMMLQETLTRLNEANYLNHLRSDPVSAALLKRRDEFIAQWRDDLPQATQDRLKSQIRDIDSRLGDFEAPAPVSLGDAFEAAIQPNRWRLLMNTGLGFAARAFKTDVKELVGKDLELAELRDELQSMEERLAGLQREHDLNAEYPNLQQGQKLAISTLQPLIEAKRESIAKLEAS